MTYGTMYVKHINKKDRDPPHNYPILIQEASMESCH